MRPLRNTTGSTHVTLVVALALALCACSSGSGGGGTINPDGGAARGDGGRGPTPPGTPPPPPGTPPPPPGSSTDSYVDGDSRRVAGTPAACDETCSSSMDGECDDGAMGSMYSVCAYGTDCADCGMRDPAACVPDCTVTVYDYDEATGMETMTEAPKTCGDDGCGGSCGGCAEGECDDYEGRCYVCRPQCDGRTCGDDGCGGQCGTCAAGQYCNGSTGVCAAGTPLCNDACRFAGDGDCDDGGAMCKYNLCDFGSDCTDCGTRTEADRRPDPEAPCESTDADAGPPAPPPMP